MPEFFAYELTQFIMISPEVWQDLHQRYFKMLWPWLMLLALANCLFFIEKYQRLFSCYIALSWLLLAFIYVRQFISEVHTADTLIMIMFILQASLILLLEIVFKERSNQSEKIKRFVLVRKVGILIYSLCAFIPFSFFAENTKETVLLFGWGAEQTAMGTIGWVLYRYHHKAALVVLFIPCLWLMFTMFLI